MKALLITASSSSISIAPTVPRLSIRKTAFIAGAIMSFMFGPSDPQAVIERIAAEETRIVSLTITPQTQHSLRNAEGGLNLENADIQNDLNPKASPKTILGYLLHGLRLRERKSLPGFAVMNLDNIEHNGDLLKTTFRQFVEKADPALLPALDSKLTFPNSMVDRIVPKTTPDFLSLVEKRLGLQDLAAVPAEPMPSISWALEGHKFPNGRPAWEKLGLVKIAEDVAPFEMMKLRLLNASRFGVGHLSDLKGYKIFDDAMQVPLFREFMATIMTNEAQPTLKPLPTVDLEAYKKELIDRCANTSLKDVVARTTKEGPIKNVLNTARDQLQLGLPIDLRALSVAAWMRRCRAETNEKGEAVFFDHPMAEILQKKAREGGNDPSSLFGVAEIFGDIGQNKLFAAVVGKYLALLDRPNGVETAIREAVKNSNEAIYRSGA